MTAGPCTQPGCPNTPTRFYANGAWCRACALANGLRWDSRPAPPPQGEPVVLHLHDYEQGGQP